MPAALLLNLVWLHGHKIAQARIYLHRDLGTPSKTLGWVTGASEQELDRRRSVVVSDLLWTVVSSRLRICARGMLPGVVWCL